MLDAIQCLGSIPVRHGPEAYSRLWALNCWMSRWCSKNNVGFIDNWYKFAGKPGLLAQNGIPCGRVLQSYLAA